jgi:hypothetical protein
MPGMKSPEDWDYDALQKRHLELHKPPFYATDGKAGNHCVCCPKSETEDCVLPCYHQYKVYYGFDPPLQAPPNA